MLETSNVSHLLCSRMNGAHASSVPLINGKMPYISKPHGETVAAGDPLRVFLIGARSLVLKEEGDRQVV